MGLKTLLPSTDVARSPVIGCVSAQPLPHIIGFRPSMGITPSIPEPVVVVSRKIHADLKVFLECLGGCLGLGERKRGGEGKVLLWVPQTSHVQHFRATRFGDAPRCGISCRRVNDGIERQIASGRPPFLNNSGHGDIFAGVAGSHSACRRECFRLWLKRSRGSARFPRVLSRTAVQYSMLYDFTSFIIF